MKYSHLQPASICQKMLLLSLNLKRGGMLLINI